MASARSNHRRHLPRRGRKPNSGMSFTAARRFVEQGRFDEARREYERLMPRAGRNERARIGNDLAALAAAAGEMEEATRGFRSALELDPRFEIAAANLRLLEDGVGCTTSVVESPPTARAPAEPAIRVAVLSFLFNWPSTGGGIVHTLELVDFLGRAGYDVRHIYARNLEWGVGRVEAPLPFESVPVDFDADRPAAEIQRRFRSAVDAFDPDQVIITDSWNFKPLLADAVRGYPYLLRLQAHECLCPLNNIRLLPDLRQCPKHQLATPADCWSCLEKWGHRSGGLHQAERALCGVGTPEYDLVLRGAFREAAAVLVVNPLTAALVSPYTDNVRVVTSGFDPARFPPIEGARPTQGRVQILFAGLVDEYMKGFHVLHEACAQLWAKRQDFELVATAEPVGQVDPFTRFIGWQSQADLPRHLSQAGMLAFPTLAEEALGRTAVEAMGAGIPVVASRIGGLQFTVVDGATGLLFEPGSAADLARKIERLLDDAPLRERLGRGGRARFDEHYTWDAIIEKHYRPLLTRRSRVNR